MALLRQLVTGAETEAQTGWLTEQAVDKKGMVLFLVNGLATAQNTWALDTTRQDNSRATRKKTSKLVTNF